MTSSVQLLVGPYRSGKSRRLFADLIQSCSGNKLAGALLVVPSSRYRKLAQDRLRNQLLYKNDPEKNEETGKGLLGFDIKNFYNLCGEILKRAGITYKLIPDSVRAAIVARAMTKLKEAGQLDNLEPLSEFKGTYGSVLELIDEFQRAGLSPSDVLGRLNKSASCESKHLELARVYRQYWSELDSIGFLDNRRLAFSAREYLAQRKDTSNLFGFIGVDGFDRFNRLQLDVLKELSRFCDQLKICFDYVENIEESELKQEYIWKESSYKDLIAKFDSTTLEWFHQDSHEIADSECFKVVDRYLEMEEIARSVKQNIVENKVKPEDILVVVPSMKKYRSSVETAFEDAEVPCFVDDAVPLSTMPVVQYLLKLISLYKEDFSRSSVVNVVSNYHFNSKRYKQLSAFASLIDNITLEHNLVAQRKNWEKLTLADELKRELNLLFDCVTPPEGTNTLTSYVSWVEDVVYHCLKQIDEIDHGDPVQNWYQDSALMEFRNCLGALVQEDIVLNGGNSGVMLDYMTFLGHLEHTIDRANFRSIAFKQNPVNVTSVDLAPNRKFSVVYIAGLAEGEFPRRKKARGFVSYDEIGHWFSYGVEIDNPRLHPAFEYGLFQSLIKRACDRIFLSYPMWDMGGDEVLPSFFVSGESFIKKTKEIAPYKESSLKPYSLKDFVSGGFASGRNIRSFSNFHDPEVLEIIESLEEPYAMLLARARKLTDSNYNGSLKEQVAVNALEVNLPEMWSASRLNEYGKCPFRYWVTHVLKLEAHEEPSDEVDVRLLGMTYHRALEIFYERVIDLNISSISADASGSKELFDEAVREAVQWLESESSVTDNEFWKFEKKEIEFRLNRFFEKEIERESKAKEAFYPYKVEAAFGMDEPESAPALVLSDGDKSVSLRGRIDRVDINGEAAKGKSRFRVVDYKAGSTFISSREAEAGRNLQMPLYMMALKNAVGSSGDPVEGVYLSVSSGGSIGRVKFKTGEELDELYEQVKAHVLNYVTSIGEGDFKVYPNGNTVCDSCEHKLICRINEMRKG